MASIAYVICARDPDGSPLVGLSPTWRFLKALATGVNIATPPPISEIAFGQYKFSFDPETSGDSTGQIDLGSSVPASTRYIDVALYRTESRLDANLDIPVSTRSTFAGGPVASVTAPVVASSVTAPVVAASVTAPVVAASVTAPVVASTVTGSVGSVVSPVKIQQATLGITLS